MPIGYTHSTSNKENQYSVLKNKGIFSTAVQLSLIQHAAVEVFGFLRFTFHELTLQPFSACLIKSNTPYSSKNLKCSSDTTDFPKTNDPFLVVPSSITNQQTIIKSVELLHSSLHRLTLQPYPIFNMLQLPSPSVDLKKVHLQIITTPDVSFVIDYLSSIRKIFVKAFAFLILYFYKIRLDCFNIFLDIFN